MKKIIIIPARLNSSRLPKKLLLDLCGKTILRRVYEQCTKVNSVKVYIATDSVLIKHEAASFTENIIMTKPSHISGTERVVEAASKIDYDMIVNVQGDEPFIKPKLIEDLFNSLEKSDTIISSAMQRIKKKKDLINPNCVKVITDKNNDAICFSRSITPHIRDEIEKVSDSKGNIYDRFNFYKHIGIYAYKKKFLDSYSNLKKSSLENFEKLEQLRVTENGIRINMIETKYNSLSIDTREDYKYALKLIKSDN